MERFAVSGKTGGTVHRTIQGFEEEEEEIEQERRDGKLPRFRVSIGKTHIDPLKALQDAAASVIQQANEARELVQGHVEGGDDGFQRAMAGILHKREVHDENEHFDDFEVAEHLQEDLEGVDLENCPPALHVVFHRAARRGRAEGNRDHLAEAMASQKLRSGLKYLTAPGFPSKPGKKRAKGDRAKRAQAEKEAENFLRRMRKRVGRWPSAADAAGNPARAMSLSRFSLGSLSSLGSSTLGSETTGSSRRRSWTSSMAADADEKNLPERRVEHQVVVKGRLNKNWEADLLKNYEALPANRMRQRRQIERMEFNTASAEAMAKQSDVNVLKVCPTTSVNPNLPKEIDLAFTSRQGVIVKIPTNQYAPPVQLWEPFIVAAVLSLPYYQEFHGREKEEEIEVEDHQPGVMSWHERHVEKLISFSPEQLKKLIPGSLLKMHLSHPALKEADSNFLKVLVSFMNKKFEPVEFLNISILEYIKDSLFEPSASPDGRTERIYVLGPYLLQLLRNEAGTVFEGQYPEMIEVMQAMDLPVLNIVEAVTLKREAISKSVWSAALEHHPPDLDFEQVHLYLDTSLVQRRYGGYSLAPDKAVLTPMDELLVRKVGATLEDIVKGRNIVAVLQAEEAMHEGGKKKKKKKTAEEIRREKELEELENADARSASFHSFFSDPELVPELEGKSKLKSKKTLNLQADVSEPDSDDDLDKQRLRAWHALRSLCIDPEDGRFMPLGLTLVEAFVLIQGMVIAMDRRPDADGDGKTDVEEGHQRILRTNVSVTCRDRHIIAAALLIELYMREKVDIWAWQLANDDAVNDVHGKGASAAAKSDAWAGTISNVYRVFTADDSPLWTTEIPPTPLAEGPGAPHWMQMYLPLVDDIFNTMEVPPFIGEQPIWESLIERGCLYPTDEDVDQYLLFQRWLRATFKNHCCLLRLVLCAMSLWKMVGCLFRLLLPCFWTLDCLCWPVTRCCCRRRLEERKMKKPAMNGDHTPAHEEQLKDLTVYEFMPPPMPHSRAGQAQMAELESRRRLAEDLKVVPDAARQKKRGPKFMLPSVDEGEEDSMSEMERAESRVTRSMTGKSTQSKQSKASSRRSKKSKASSRGRNKDDARSQASSRYETESDAASEQSMGYTMTSDDLSNASWQKSSATGLTVDEQKRVSWWERMKLLYCDAYFLMFEEGAVYFEEEQEIALWRAQVLMFFYALQTLFELAWEGQNGFERVMQAMCPPFAKLPLRPPPGMEGAGAIIRGLVQRARLAGQETADNGIRNLAVEAGEFQEKLRKKFRLELFGCRNLLKVFDGDGDGEITLDEFIAGIMKLPASGQLRFGGMPEDVLEQVLSDLATELFHQIDVDGGGTLSNQEIRDAIEEFHGLEMAQNKPTEGVAGHLHFVKEQIPGTKEYKARQLWRQKEVERIRESYDQFLRERKHETQAEADQKNFEKMKKYVEGKKAKGEKIPGSYAPPRKGTKKDKS